MNEVKRYEFTTLYDSSNTGEHVAPRSQEYVLASDYDAEHQRRVEAEELIKEYAGADCAKADKYLGIGPCGVCESCRARAYLARYKERDDT